MKIQIDTTKTEVIDIQLPYYCKNNYFAYKIYSEDKCLQVSYHRFVDKAIQVSFASLPFRMNDKPVQIDELEFFQIYNQVSNELRNLV